MISLEGSTPNSPVRKYMMKSAPLNFITADDLQIPHIQLNVLVVAFAIVEIVPSTLDQLTEAIC